MILCGHVFITQGPRFTLQFSWCCIFSRFGQIYKLHIHLHSIIRSNFSALKMICAPRLIYPLPQPLATFFFFFCMQMLIVPAPLVKHALFSPSYSLRPFVKVQSPVHVGVYPRAVRSAPPSYASVL